MSFKHPLVELSEGALTRLAKVPRYGDGSRGVAAEIERDWVRAPLTLAIGGPISARTELVNFLCGKKVLDPEARPIESAALRIRRGKKTRFKAIRDDGTTEAHDLPPEQIDDDDLRMRAQAARAEKAERQLALERVDHHLPRFARTRPRGFRILLWPLWWFVTRRHRRALADRRFTEMAFEESSAALDAAEKELDGSVTRLKRERGRFFESLRALSSGPPLGSNVREVALELGEGPLPEGIELIEQTRSGHAAEQVDAIFLVERSTFHAPHSTMEVGSIGEVIPQLPAVLGRARTLALARRARDQIKPRLGKLDDEVNDTEEGFRVRIERLEAMQILDAEEFARKEIGKVRQQITQSIHAVIEHAAAHLGSELQRLGEEWGAGIGHSTNNDELKTAVHRIETTAPLDAKRIADECRRLAIGGASGSAHDLMPELFASLRPHGLSEPPPRNAPQVPSFELLPSLTNASPSKLSGAGNWLTGLFRSFDTRRADVATKALDRIKHLREVAQAEILDAEPQLQSTIELVLYTELLGAIARQVAWLEAAMTVEREAVAREGATLAPLARMRDRLRTDLARIEEGIAVLEAENPALAASAAITTSAA